MADCCCCDARSALLDAQCRCAATTDYAQMIELASTSTTVQPREDDGGTKQSEPLTDRTTAPVFVLASSGSPTAARRPAEGRSAEAGGAQRPSADQAGVATPSSGRRPTELRLSTFKPRPRLSSSGSSRELGASRSASPAESDAAASAGIPISVIIRPEAFSGSRDDGGLASTSLKLVTVAVTAERGSYGVPRPARPQPDLVPLLKTGESHRPAKHQGNSTDSVPSNAE